MESIRWLFGLTQTQKAIVITIILSKLLVDVGRVRCCVAGRYRFQIINMSKNRSLYQRGMKPFVRNSVHGIWRQNGRNIEYEKNNSF